MTSDLPARRGRRSRIRWGVGIAAVLAGTIVVSVILTNGGTKPSRQTTQPAAHPAVLSGSDTAALSQTLTTGSSSGASAELLALEHKALQPGTRGVVKVDPGSLRIAPVSTVGSASGSLADGKKVRLVLILEHGHWKLLSAAVIK